MGKYVFIFVLYEKKMEDQVASQPLRSTSPSFVDRSGNGVKDDIKKTDEGIQMSCPTCLVHSQTKYSKLH